ncbi:MAG: SpoIIE family protein phosphatase [Phycisphaerales bacterium]|nr:SpoIIE family protein phosphatase [Phycisphaerales bacterium]
MTPGDINESTTASMHRQAGPLHLRAIAGPPVTPVEIVPGEPVTIGRSTQCKVQLSDAAVSRKHVTIEHSRDRWVVTDEGSRHGTLVNGIAIKSGEATPIEHGDALTVGPWIFRVITSGRVESTLATMDDRARRNSSVHVVAPGRLGSLAQRRLMLLMESTTAIQNVGSEEELAARVMPVLREGTGFRRAALVRMLDSEGQLEIIGAEQDPGSSALQVSRSLLEAARRGEVVELESQPDLQHAVSIMDAGVTSAMCAPVEVGSTVVACLYLDAAAARPVEPDAAAFVAAVAKLCGLAMANLSRRSLERRQAEMMRELHAAQQVQRRMMPADEGVFGGYRFAMRAQPGRIVAGDVFGILPLEDGSAAVFIGDVTSKGLGPAMIMAAIQSYVAAALKPGIDARTVVSSLNRHLAAQTADTEFASLWFALLDPAGNIDAVDAGHGYALLHRKGGVLEQMAWRGGLLVGVDATSEYETHRASLEPGDRLILMSDGLVEQRGEDESMFGVDRAKAILRDTREPVEDVSALHAALKAFAGGDAFEDDVTLASIERVG